MFTPMQQVTRRQLLAGSLGLGAVLVSAACGAVPAAPAAEAPKQPEKAAPAAPKAEVKPAAKEVKEVKFWHPYGPPWDAGMERTVASFNQAFPTYRASAISLPDLYDKLPPAVVAGTAGDVTHLWGVARMIAYSEGVIVPIDDVLKRLPQWKQEDVFPGFLETVQYQGRIWGLPAAAQPTSVVWGKQASLEVGLDPEKAPASQAEFEDAIKKFTKATGGKIERIGFIPRMWGGFFNFAYHWGGKFYDEKSQKITASDPVNVAALQWIVDLYGQYGGQAAVAEWLKQFQRRNDPLYQGKQGMDFFSHYMYYSVQVEQPDWQYGFGIIPPLGPASVQPKGPVAHTDVNAVVKGTKDPEGATLLVWWSTLGDGFVEAWTKVTAHPSASVSLNQKAVAQNLIAAWYPKKLWEQNFEVLKKARGWPMIPVLNELGAELEKAHTAAVKKEKTAAVALQDVDKLVQALLEEKLRKK